MGLTGLVNPNLCVLCSTEKIEGKCPKCDCKRCGNTLQNGTTCLNCLNDDRERTKRARVEISVVGVETELLPPAQPVLGNSFALGDPSASIPSRKVGNVLMNLHGNRLLSTAPECGGSGELNFNPDPFLKSVRTCKKVTWTVMQFPADSREAGFDKLHEHFNMTANHHFSALCAMTGPGKCTALIHKPGNHAFELPDGWSYHTINKRNGRDHGPVADFAKRLLLCAHKTTMDFETISGMTSKQALAPYMHLSMSDFEAMMLDLPDMPATELEPEQKYLLRKGQQKVQSLRKRMVDDAMARKLVIPCGDELRFPDDFINLDKVRCYRYCFKIHQWKLGDFVNTVLLCRDTHCLVIYGPPNTSKTPCARSIAQLWTRGAGASSFIKASTADSLRKVQEADLFGEGMAVLLDEWRPPATKVGSQGGGCDFMKCICDVMNASGVQARYSDFSFEENMSRLITCQSFPSMEELCQEVNGKSMSTRRQSTNAASLLVLGAIADRGIH